MHIAPGDGFCHAASGHRGHICHADMMNGNGPCGRRHLNHPPQFLQVKPTQYPDLVFQNPASKISAETVANLTILVLTAMVMILNETALSVALPTIMADFSIPATSAQWLLTGFLLTMGVVIPTTGFLLDKFTTRQIFGTSTGVFLTGTVLAALAPFWELLLAGRVLQAVGTALMIPTLMTVAMTLVPPQRRGTVMGIITVVISVAPALGPTAGGFIVGMASWHAIFWTMVPLIAAVSIAGYVRLVNVGERSDTPLDIPSVFLSALAFGGLIYGLSSIDKMVEGGALADALLLLLGILALIAFTRRQLRLVKVNRALLDLRPFKVRNFTLAVIAMLLMFALLLGTVNILPIYLQTSLAVSSLVTGLVVMPGGLVQGGISPIVGRIYDAFGPRPILIPGAMMFTTGIWLMTLLTQNSEVWMVIGMHMLFAVGIALMMTPLMTVSLSSLPQELHSHGSAILNTLQQLAGAAGTAFLVAFLTRGTESGKAEGMSEAAATAQGAHWAFLFAGMLSLFVLVLAPLLKRVPAAG